MTQGTGQRARRNKSRGSQISRLAFELLQPNGIDLLGRMCANESVSLPHRLKVVDTAIAVKLTSREELVDHGGV